MSDAIAKLTQNEEDALLTDREILLETLRLQRDTNAKITEAAAAIQEIVAEVGPTVKQLTESPAMKMLGFGKKRFGE